MTNPTMSPYDANIRCKNEGKFTDGDFVYDAIDDDDAPVATHTPTENVWFVDGEHFDPITKDSEWVLP